MKVLMLVNWKVVEYRHIPSGVQIPDYVVNGEPYWFFRYFPKDFEIEVRGIGSSFFTNVIEKKYFRFYSLQTLKVLWQLNRYDLVISHGAQSGVLLAFFKRIFRIKTPRHILFDIGSFNSASERGMVYKLMKYVSHSIDGIIYHTSSQRDYYKTHFPWLLSKSVFIPFGVDTDMFWHAPEKNHESNTILSIGYIQRDWKTLIDAFQSLGRNDVVLKIIGKSDLELSQKNIVQEGFIPISKLISEIRNSLMVVIPLEYFNYSYGQMTVLHAMALGKPVLVAQVPSMTDYIEDFKTGVFYKSGDVEDLKEKMELLIEDRALRTRLSIEGSNAIVTKFNEKEMAAQIFRFVNLITQKTLTHR